MGLRTVNWDFINMISIEKGKGLLFNLMFKHTILMLFDINKICLVALR